MTSIVVATLMSAASHRDAFARALHRTVEARFCDDGMELRFLLATAAVDAIVTDLEMAHRRSVWQAARSTHESRPGIPVLLWLSITRPDMRDLAQVSSEMLPDAVIIREIDDVSSVIAAAIRSMREGNATQRVIRAIERVAPASVRPILVSAARDAERLLTIARMAANVGLTRQALLERLRGAGVPNARDLIHWLRLLHVAARLDVPRMTVEHVATSMRFASSGALCQLLRRMTGLTPDQLRDAGGFSYLVGIADSMFNVRTSADRDSPIADLGHLDRRGQCAWYESRRFRSR